jgi:hypothetical protein
LRRVTRAELAPIEGRVESILRLYERRYRECDHRTAQSIMPLIQSVMRLGCFPGGSPACDPLPLSPVQRWLVDTAAALHDWSCPGCDTCCDGGQTGGTGCVRCSGEERETYCSDVARFIVHAHVTRSSNTERAFGRIAYELERRGVALLEGEVADIYAHALMSFDRILSARGISRDVQHDHGERRHYLPRAINDDSVSIAAFVGMLRRADAASIAA